MDAIEYFLTYSALFVAVLGIVFFLVGMFFGTLLSAGLRSRLKDCRNNLADCQTSSALLKNQIAEFQEQSQSASQIPGFTPADPTAPEESQADQENTPPTDEEQPGDPDTVSGIAPAGFDSKIASGQMIYDEKLGAIYAGQPDDADDLTKIKGIGKVLNGKLNKFGIYKFKQIALWDEANITVFAERFSFKDRIFRDDWPSQARKFHQEEYDEEI
jgi:predicted flap endonuclease-1-like 5' DNA nuclease